MMWMIISTLQSWSSISITELSAGDSDPPVTPRNSQPEILNSAKLIQTSDSLADYQAEYSWSPCRVID